MPSNAIVKMFSGNTQVKNILRHENGLTNGARKKFPTVVRKRTSNSVSTSGCSGSTKNARAPAFFMR